MFKCKLHTMLVQAVVNIMYLGLNCMHCTGPVWSPLRITTFAPVSVFQQWIFPSVEPSTNKHSYLTVITKSAHQVGIHAHTINLYVHACMSTKFAASEWQNVYTHACMHTY